MVKAFRALARGDVQGVGFRYSAAREARRLGLRGWVRNLPGGEVEVWAEGGEAELEEFASWLGQGPPQARVDSLDLEYGEPTGSFGDFSIAF